MSHLPRGTWKLHYVRSKVIMPWTLSINPRPLCFGHWICCNTDLTFKCREISFVHNIHVSWPIVLKICTEHDRLGSWGISYGRTRFEFKFSLDEYLIFEKPLVEYSQQYHPPPRQHHTNMHTARELLLFVVVWCNKISAIAILANYSQEFIYTYDISKTKDEIKSMCIFYRKHFIFKLANPNL